MSAPAHHATRTWLLLLAATAATFAAGEAWPAHGAHTAVVAALGALTLFKGRLIAREFMGLANTRLLWRALVLGWMTLVLALVALAWWLGST